MTERVKFDTLLIVYDDYNDPQLFVQKDEVAGFSHSYGSIKVHLKNAPAVDIELHNPRAKIAELISELGWT